VYSVIDFTSAFGGRTTGLELRVLEMDHLVAISKDFFVEGELEESKKRVDLAIKGLTEITDDSIRLKDSTFLWIYLTQWLVVTATSMICGFILWSLMVRRRIYREVKTTRTS
jgi:hypothetical protein